VDHAAIRDFIEAKSVAKLNASTIGHCIRLLSSLFTDLVERKLATDNPDAAVVPMDKTGTLGYAVVSISEPGQTKSVVSGGID
jgi:hypothetical protein